MKELEDIVVNLRTQAEYDEYMQMCEDAGWTWLDRYKPTQFNGWRYYREKTCILVRKRLIPSSFEYCWLNGYKIITLKELKELNGVPVYVSGVHNLNNIKTKTFMTNIKEVLKKLTLQEPNKTLHKAGLMDLDGNWNEEVRHFALEEMLNNHMATEDFKAKMLELAKANEADKKTE